MSDRSLWVCEFKRLLHGEPVEHWDWIRVHRFEDDADSECAEWERAGHPAQVIHYRGSHE